MPDALPKEPNRLGLSDDALLHLHILSSIQGTSDTVRLNTKCPRCQELLAKLEAVE